jgi:hypothetical protein
MGPDSWGVEYKAEGDVPEQNANQEIDQYTDQLPAPFAEKIYNG